jgi:hypothetical protein
VKIALVFEPNPELGHDPLDPHKRPYRLGEFFDSDERDVLLLVRQWDEKFEGGSETQVYSSGTWESIDGDQVEAILDELGALPE